MVSSRASEIAELLWELKKNDKIARYSTLAKQAGFSAGMNGRTMVTTIRTIRRDWPHLEWWRAISDDGLFAKDSEHETKLRESGYEFEDAKGKRGSLTIKSVDKYLMSWEGAGAGGRRRVIRSSRRRVPVIPHRFLFRFRMPVRAVDPPESARAVPDLSTLSPLPDFGSLDGSAPFAQVRTGWHEKGIGFRVTVAGKRMPIHLAPDQPRESDGLQLWLDTRNTQTIHRASRFCHAFIILPGGGRAGAPLIEQLAIAQAKEDAPTNRVGLIRASLAAKPGGWELDVWIPRESLYGYEPESNPLLGFSYAIRDAELGEQFLTVGREFPIDHDPSLWSTLELTR